MHSVNSQLSPCRSVLFLGFLGVEIYGIFVILSTVLIVHRACLVHGAWCMVHGPFAWAMSSLMYAYRPNFQNSKKYFLIQIISNYII